jgi:molybdopterin synthase sulfur carrier subunit
MPTVFIPAQMKELTAGASTVEVSGSTVREAIADLDRKFPGIAQRLCRGDTLIPGLQVSVDHVMTGRGMRAKLKPNSEVHFLPAIGGG